jgi:hypothetical protein
MVKAGKHPLAREGRVHENNIEGLTCPRQGVSNGRMRSIRRLEHLEVALNGCNRRGRLIQKRAVFGAPGKGL